MAYQRGYLILRCSSLFTITAFLKDHQPHSNFMAYNRWLIHIFACLVMLLQYLKIHIYIFFYFLSNILLVSRTVQRGWYSVCPVTANSIRILCSKYIHWLSYFQPQIFLSKSNTFYKFPIFMDKGFENFYLYISNTFGNSPCEFWFNLHKK